MEISRFDRQLILWGEAGQSHIEKSSVCIIGDDLLASEIAKGLLLANCKSLTIITSDCELHSPEANQSTIPGVFPENTSPVISSAPKFESAENDFEENFYSAHTNCSSLISTLQQFNKDASLTQSGHFLPCLLNNSPEYFDSFYLVIACNQWNYRSLIDLKLPNVRKLHCFTFGFAGLLINNAFDSEYFIVEDARNDENGTEFYRNCQFPAFFEYSGNVFSNVFDKKSGDDEKEENQKKSAAEEIPYPLIVCGLISKGISDEKVLKQELQKIYKKHPFENILEAIRKTSHFLRNNKYLVPSNVLKVIEMILPGNVIEKKDFNGEKESNNGEKESKIEKNQSNNGEKKSENEKINEKANSNEGSQIETTDENQINDNEVHHNSNELITHDALENQNTNPKQIVKILVKATSKFIKAFNRLPVVPSLLPDINTNTFNYQEMLSVLQKQHSEDLEFIWNAINQEESNSFKREDYKIEEFIKHLPFMHCLNEEIIGEPKSVTGENKMDLLLNLFLGTESFSQTYKRLPGVNDELLTVDYLHLRMNVLSKYLNKSQSSAELFNQPIDSNRIATNSFSVEDFILEENEKIQLPSHLEGFSKHIEDWVDFGNVQFPTTCTAVGGVICQEAIKILSHVYLPITNRITVVDIGNGIQIQ